MARFTTGTADMADQLEREAVANRKRMLEAADLKRQEVAAEAFYRGTMHAVAALREATVITEAEMAELVERFRDPRANARRPSPAV